MFMFRLLLIVALSLTQLLSLGTGSLYLCLGEDGHFCFESQPDDCTCCSHEVESEHEESDSCCSTVDQCPPKTGRSTYVVAVNDDCECTHVLLPNNLITAVSDSDPLQKLRFVEWSVAPITSTLAYSCELERPIAPVDFGERYSYALTSLRCVILQC